MRWQRAFFLFSGDSSGAIFDEILHKDPVDPVRLNTAIPPEFAQVIHKGWRRIVTCAIRARPKCARI